MHVGLEICPLENSKEICPKQICKLKRGGRYWIICDLCSQWFHCSCVKITMAEADQFDSWNCYICTSKERER